MNELNERDLERVSGGLSDGEAEQAIERLYRNILAKECGACKREDKSNCRATLKELIRNMVSAGTGRTTCPMKR